MALQFGNKQVKELYFGDKKVAKVYYGSKRVWPATEDGTIVCYIKYVDNSGILPNPPVLATDSSASVWYSPVSNVGNIYEYHILEGAGTYMFEVDFPEENLVFNIDGELQYATTDSSDMIQLNLEAGKTISIEVDIDEDAPVYATVDAAIGMLKDTEKWYENAGQVADYVNLEGYLEASGDAILSWEDDDGTHELELISSSSIWLSNEYTFALIQVHGTLYRAEISDTRAGTWASYEGNITGYETYSSDGIEVNTLYLLE